LLLRLLRLLLPLRLRLRLLLLLLLLLLDHGLCRARVPPPPLPVPRLASTRSLLALSPARGDPRCTGLVTRPLMLAQSKNVAREVLIVVVWST
jgi:hypothetical protein